MHARDYGYSLLELLMTMAVAALILTLGLPSFAALKARNAQRVELNALFHAVHLARKASIMRKQVVSLCPTADGTTCSPGTDWSGGFLVFVNSDRDEPPELDDGEILLDRHLTRREPDEWLQVTGQISLRCNTRRGARAAESARLESV